MEYIFNTRLRGNIALTDSYHTNLALQKDNTLYKFIWVQSGSLQLEIDHVPTTLVKGEIIPLTPLHHIEFKAINGEYLTLLFNSNFYCIFGHDNEVSCNGFLFNGTSNVMQLKLSESQVASLRDITDSLTSEYAIKDNLQEEMLRILLKRFIILCTRIAREKFSVSPEREKAFDMVRQFYVLVDNHFKERRWSKIMRICCIAPQKPYPTFLRLADYLLRYGSFMNELRLRPNDCYYIARRVRRKSRRSWASRIKPHSAVFSRK